MFYHIRFQTGEIKEIIEDMQKGNIPCMDVIDYDDLNNFLKSFSDYGYYKVKDLDYNRNARDKVKEPEFEFRITFSNKDDIFENLKNEKLFYIDFYFEPYIEETYSSIYGD